jgi:quercetin dioxygenase-like cupin family protein
MPFIEFDKMPKMELFEGVLSRLATGERIMLSSLDMEQGAIVPEHSHPHEQAGLVLKGRFNFRIGDEEREVGPGEAFIIPGHVVHAGVVTQGPAQILDIFTPVREDYAERYNNFATTSDKTVWEESKGED